MKYLVVLLAIGFTQETAAQFRKREMFAEGFASFRNFQKPPFGPPTGQNRELVLSPSFGYMLSGKTALIGGVRFEARRFWSPTGPETGTSVSVFAGVRRFFPITDTFSFFAQGLVGFGNQLADMYGGAFHFSASGFNGVNLQLSPGVAFFPHERFGVTARVGSLVYKFKARGVGPEILFNAGTVNLGLMYRFNKK